MEDDEDSDGSEHSYGGGGSREKKSKKSKKQQKPIQKIGLSKEDEKYPTDVPKDMKIDFDWCDELGVIREVIDQGNRRNLSILEMKAYGTCWTVASSRNLSACLVINKRFDPPVWLSALHLLVGLIDKVDSKGGLKNLEDLQKFLVDYGTVLENDCQCPQLALEYKNDKTKPRPVLCTDKGKAQAKHTPMFKVEDLIIRYDVDEKELMELVRDAPVAVSMEVYEDFLSFKGDGIYDGTKKKGRKIDNHLMLVSGYGTKMPEKIHYWKVQNSAGIKWGNKGFGKIIRQISRERGAPSMFTCVVYPKLLPHYEGQKENV